MGKTTTYEVVEIKSFLRGGAVRVGFEDEVAGEDIWVLNLREKGARKAETVRERAKEELA